MTSNRAGALRRYPALGFLVIAGVLATMLPSSLRLPLSGPTQAAEIAPVPGQGDGESGDLAELGSGSSGGLGGGRGGEGAAESAASDAPVGVGSNPTTKRCVGRPPRQTEDPLSPPCVAFFEGDNGGATTRGVTGDEIRVAIHLGATTEEVAIDFADPQSAGTAGQAEISQVIRAYQRFVNERYQTYGRRLRVFGYSGPGFDAESTRAHITAIEERWRPFAFIPVGSNSPLQLQAKEAAARGMVAVAFSGLDRADHRRLAPRLLSYNPDLQDHSASVASLLCTSLTGRPARYAGSPDLQSSPRHFGLLWQDNAEVPEYGRLAQLTKEDAGRRCGITFSEAVARTTNEGQADYAQNIAAMRTAGVTTLVFFSSITGPTGWGNAAAAQQWYPEWVVPGSTGMTGADMNASAQAYSPLVWSGALGLTFDVRRGVPAEQPWFSAYRSACGDCPVPADYRAARLYNILTLLMWGIQAAGPGLTPQTMDRGLHAIQERSSADPSVPAAYFSPGNYSWIKDAAAIRWDTAATEPGGSRPGCYRMAHGGRRSRPSDWPAGDAWIAASGQPCQGPTR